MTVGLQSIIGVRNPSNGLVTNSLLVPGIIKGETRIVGFELYNSIPVGASGVSMSGVSFAVRSVYGGDAVVDGGYLRFAHSSTMPIGRWSIGGLGGIELTAGVTVPIEMQVAIPADASVGSFATFEIYPTGGFINGDGTDGLLPYYGRQRKYADGWQYGSSGKSMASQLESWRGIVSFQPILLIFDPILSYEMADDYSSKGIRFST